MVRIANKEQRASFSISKPKSKDRNWTAVGMPYPFMPFRAGRHSCVLYRYWWQRTLSSGAHTPLGTGTVNQRRAQYYSCYLNHSKDKHSSLPCTQWGYGVLLCCPRQFFSQHGIPWFFFGTSSLTDMSVLPWPLAQQSLKIFLHCCPIFRFESQLFPSSWALFPSKQQKQHFCQNKRQIVGEIL